MSYVGVQMARHKGAMTAADVNDTAVTVRPASTANFYVSSLDKGPTEGSGDFTINKPNSLFNGFFTRLAVNEVVMDWGLPNVAAWWGNDTFTVYINNAGTVAGPFTVALDDGFYSALDTLNALVTALNNTPAVAAITTFTVGTSGTQVGLGAGKPFVVTWNSNPALTTQQLSRQLFTSAVLYDTFTQPVPPLAASITEIATYCVSPAVLGTRFVDIVSTQLTYNQDLKDNTTSRVQRDVLYRWYFAWDNQTGNDSLLIAVGPPSVTLQTFPVYQGYRPFLARRNLPYPKQIAWNNTQPIGQVSFQVFDDQNRLIDTNKFVDGANFQFQLSMLVTEN
jgi:hypothetical protein